jgi:hypothetical protein
MTFHRPHFFLPFFHSFAPIIHKNRDCTPAQFLVGTDWLKMRVLMAALLLTVSSAFAPSCRRSVFMPASRLNSAVAEAPSEVVGGIQPVDKIRYVLRQWFAG